MSKEVNLIIMAKESSMEDVRQTSFHINCDLLFDKCMCQVSCFENESQIKQVQEFGEANNFEAFDDSFKKYKLKLTLEEYEE